MTCKRRLRLIPSFINSKQIPIILILLLRNVHSSNCNNCLLILFAGLLINVKAHCHSWVIGTKCYQVKADIEEKKIKPNNGSSFLFLCFYFIFSLARIFENSLFSGLETAVEQPALINHYITAPNCKRQVLQKILACSVL